jgi:biopolymer transport protein ExbB
VVILWKALVMRRVRQDLGQAIPAFWAAPDWEVAAQRLASMDREQVLAPLVDAARRPTATGTLETQSHRHSQVTRRVRDALQASVATLQFGQVLLASIGSTAPFVGLLGTVWGIYHALLEIGAAGNFTLDKVAGPVGEALIMTAAGLAVAIPAVLAYNLFGKWVHGCEAQLEGFAHDLRELALESAAPPPSRSAD